MTRRSSVGVLVVDDSEALGRMLVEVLERRGYAARWVGSGDEAVAAAKAEPPQVVLLDVNLGEQDGLEVAGTLRALPDLKGVRIIGLSGDPVPPQRKRSLDGFLLKPVALPSLLDALER